MIRACAVALSLLSTLAFAHANDGVYTCQTSDPLYDVVLDSYTTEMAVEGNGVTLTGYARYFADLSTDNYAFYLRTDLNRGFTLIIRGEQPWQLCADRLCQQCDETR